MKKPKIHDKPGRPSKGIETSTLNFRLPKTRIKELKEKYPKQLSKLFREWQATL